ncbi:hypothetical protein DQ04_01181190 [Trypanosoma grayi]|uniref:hypothetical protein n=1 Tax=Trypanosoma grayi TaxID=71804 RepID=UPI0004F4954D|nr:hypothetical protein DQ04_01181190 [Trypanosoma grayi]KEG13165.1 hypothetical protein DQ04_01181190 [Trypanosoma grayi]
MKSLLDRCLFRREWDDGKVEEVVKYAGSGKAKLFRTGAFTSFSVKESHQGDVRHLPTGARTLLLDANAGEVVVRGVNKFFDIEDVERDLDDIGKLWEMGSVWLQRKMAGFTVTCFSLDGESVSIATKHVVEGPHVDVARRILCSSLSAEQQKQLASDLFLTGAALSCECISAKDDPHHPVPERNEYDNTLVIFSAHKRSDLREVSVSFETMRVMAERWGLPVVPCWRVSGREELHGWLQERGLWRGKGPDGMPLGEGYVLLVEVPTSHLSPTVIIKDPFTVVPVRLKAKTVKYRVLRSLRSIVAGDSVASPQLFHEVLAVWSEHVAGYRCFRQAVTEHGVFNLCSQFEKHVSERNGVRLRGSEMSIGRAFERLVEFTEKQAHARSQAPLHVAMLCGIPGVGKSTLAQAITEMAERGCSPFRYVIHLNRDRVANDVAVREGIDGSASKHKQRKLRAMVHHAMLNALTRLILLSFLHKGPGLLIMDACNAKVDTRRLWRDVLPKELESFRIFHVTCTDNSTLLQRLANREDHEVLHDLSEAQAALYAVKKSFVEPPESELCVRLDTAISSAEDIARRVLSLYTGDKQPHASIYDCRQAEEELTTLRAALIGSLVGSVDRDVSKLFANTVKRARAGTTVLVQLNMSFDKLIAIAADTIMSVVASSGSSESLWERCRCAPDFDVRRCAAKVEEGHTRWIRGWLFDGSDSDESFSVDAWRHALEERFECKPCFPHVTLVFDGSNAEALSLLPMPGSTAEVTLSSVLLDRSALCFSATVAANGQCYEHQLDSPVAVPLHVTVAHTSEVKASCAGMMFGLFQKWGHHNAELEQTRHDTSVKRSRLKFFNFLKAHLDTPICVRGVVVVET